MKNLLNISDINSNDLIEIFKYADLLTKNFDDCLIEKNVGLIFEKNSTRTRLSFQVGINQLGGNFIDIKLDDLNMQRFESYEDINDIDKERLISNAYLLLMTSISRNEAFGVVLIEALRSGLPLISPNIKSGVSWINQHNETGYQYNTGKFDDMLDKINKLMRIDKKNYDKMCKNAHARYEKYFKLNIMIKKIEDVYSSVSNS